MSLPELQQNPLVQRVIDIFDTDGNGEVDFKGTQPKVLDCGGSVVLGLLEITCIGIDKKIEPDTKSHPSIEDKCYRGSFLSLNICNYL